MAIKAHPDFHEIARAIQKLSKKGKAFSAICYRTAIRWPNRFWFGQPTAWCALDAPKNSFPTVYLCETVDAALQEYLARGRQMRLPDHKSLPMVMAWIKVKTANLLDMTDAEVAVVIDSFLVTDKIHWRAIQDRREAVSQALGRAVQEVCLTGLIAPSQASPRSRNTIISRKS